MSISFIPNIPMMPLAPPPVVNNDKVADSDQQQPDDKAHGHHQKGAGQKMPRQNSSLQKHLVSNMRNEPRAEKMDQKMEKTMIKAEADGAGNTAFAENTELHAAIRKQDFDWFKALLSNGADRHGMDQEGKTPLELAVNIFETTCRQRKSNDLIARARAFVTALLESGVRGNAALMSRATWAQRWRA